MRSLNSHTKIKILCVIAFIIGILSGFFCANIFKPVMEVKRVQVTVSLGDTLWDIADTYTLPENDIRYTIHRIKEINNMDTSELHPGDVIVVPIYSK